MLWSRAFLCKTRHKCLSYGVSQMKVKGTVFTGVLRGSSMIDAYYPRLINILGFAPFKGTLNVKLALEFDIKKYSTKKISRRLSGTHHISCRQQERKLLGVVAYFSRLRQRHGRSDFKREHEEQIRHKGWRRSRNRVFRAAEKAEEDPGHGIRRKALRKRDAADEKLITKNFFECDFLHCAQHILRNEIRCANSEIFINWEHHIIN